MFQTRSMAANRKVARRLLLLSLVFQLSSSENGDCPVKCECVDNTLTCNKAGLTSIPQNISNSESINVLVIDENNLKEIRATDFKQFPNLQFLDLSKNSIVKVEEGAFLQLGHLRLVDLSDNNLTSLPDYSFNGMENLTELDLSRNKLGSLKKVFHNATGLQGLKLIGNLLQDVPEDAFYGITSLTHIHLGKNLLVDVPSSALEKLPALHTLVLYGNQISMLGDCSFGRMKQLTNLQLENNAISAISKTAFSSECDTTSSGPSSLKSLDLAENLLTRVPTETLSELTNLRTLELNSNNISVISSGSMTNLTSLMAVFLSYMPSLTTVEPFAFVNLESLHSVYIHDCFSLTSISPTSFQNVPNLQDLALHRNGFKTIDKDLITWKDNLTISLSGNPFVCGCGLAWVPDFYRNKTASNVSRANLKNLYCAAPSNLKGVQIVSLSAKSFLCGRKLKSVHARLHTAVIAASICAVIAVLLLVFVKFRNRICIFAKRQFRYRAHRDNRELFSVKLSGIIDEHETESYFEDPTIDLRLVDPGGR